MRPGALPRFMATKMARQGAYIKAHQRWAQALGWCKAMLWVYRIYGWSKVSRRALESLIKKLESCEPALGTSEVVIRKPTRQQSEFLRWSCEYLGFKFKEA